MNEKDLTTYSVLTAQRMLERFSIFLPETVLQEALNHPKSLYYQLLRVPYKNILNGIIFDQAYDYQSYAQKLFVDYLLSSNPSAEENEIIGIKQSMEEAREHLANLGEEFSKHEIRHQHLIFNSQAVLIDFSKDLQSEMKYIRQQISTLLDKKDKEVESALTLYLINFDKKEFLKTLNLQEGEANVSEVLNLFEPFDVFYDRLKDLIREFLFEAKAITQILKKSRTAFANSILHCQELIRNLPDYQVNEERDAVNRALIHFNAHIGDEINE